MSPIKTVLVTGTGGRSVGSGVLHALLHTSHEVKTRWRVVAADADPFAWGLYVADAATLLPHARSPEYIPAVIQLVHRYEVDAIIPGTEIEIEPLVRNESRLAPARVIANNLDLLPLMLDKFRASEKLAELGCPTIPTVPLTDWRSLAQTYGFPLVVKPTRGTGGSRDVHLACDADDIERILINVDADTMPCVQAYIGDADDEYTVGVLTDWSGSLIDTIVMRRKLVGLSLLTSKKLAGHRYALSTGYSQGFIVREPAIQEFCEALAMQLKSRGPLNIQLRFDHRTGTPWVIEVHPRFSGTTPIRAEVGFNEPDVLLQNVLFGRKFSRLGYRTNVAAIRAFKHIVVPIEQMQQQEGS
jgi:carbamoyl-phosphate synthase large subunit